MKIQALCVKDRWTSDQRRSRRVAHFVTPDGVKFLFEYYPFTIRFIPSEVYNFECSEIRFKEALQSDNKNI